MKLTPKRVISKKGEIISVYTDNFTMENHLSEMPKRKVKIDKISNWNLKKPGGWEAYKELTEQVVKDGTLEIEEVLRKIESIEKEIK